MNVLEMFKISQSALKTCIEFINDAKITEAQWDWEPIKEAERALHILAVSASSIQPVAWQWRHAIGGDGQFGAWKPITYGRYIRRHNYQNSQFRELFAKQEHEIEMHEHSHCMCNSCKDGAIHDSCCAVHNMPAEPNGPCNCNIAQLAALRAFVREVSQQDPAQVPGQRQSNKERAEDLCEQWGITV